jgi:outer membrane protein assembly factor BamA
VRRWRGAAAVLVAAALAPVAAGAALAQSATRDPDDVWRFSLLGYPMYDGLEGLSGTGVFTWNRPPRRGPEPITATFGVVGRLSTSGTRTLQAQFDAPALWERWRLLGIAAAERFQRAPYFGLGNAPHDSGDADRRFYRYSLLRYTLTGAAQREIGHLRLHGGFQLRHYRALALGGDTTLLGRDIAAGRVSDTGSFTGGELRLGLLWDTRNEEATPSRGAFLEFVIGRDIVDLKYTRYLLSAREFIPLSETIVLGLRQSLELADRDIPFFVMYERLTSWRPEDGFGGMTSLRAHLPGRFLAPNRFVASVDVRYKYIEVPIPTAPVRVWFAGFGDVGRLWNSGESKSFADLHWDVGGGAYAQVSKATMFGLTAGVSRVDGFEFASAVSFGF